MGEVRWTERSTWCNYLVKWARKTAIYCHEEHTELFQVCHCVEGEKKERPEQLPLVRGPETKLFPPPTTGTCLTGIIWPLPILFLPGSEVSLCWFCLPIQIAQKMLSILQKWWKFSTLKHRKVLFTLNLSLTGISPLVIICMSEN